MQTRTEDIVINGMAFSPVDVEQDLENIRQGSTLTMDIDDVVLDLFKKYIVHIWNGDTAKMYATDFIHSESQAYDIENDLIVCRDFDLTKKDEFEKFNKISKKLAHQLILFMQGSTNPEAGILFILNTEISDSNHICILKVDVAKEDIRIWFDEEDLKITYARVENVLPDSNKLQKGAIYPHPTLGKQLKILQKDYKAKYFNQFLQCKKESTEFEQFEAIPKMLDTVHEELAPDVEINVKEVVNNRFNELEAGESLTTRKVVDLAKKVAPEAEEEAVQEIVRREFEKEGISDINVRRDARTKYKKEITIEDITIKGPVKSIEEKVVTEEENGIYRVVVKGNTKPIEKLRR